MMKLLKKFKIGLIINEWLNDALDIAQEYICKLSVYKVNEQTSSSSAEHKQSHLKLPELELPTSLIEML